MSVLTRPPIVTNGLVLHLDAANRKSYPGSGTTWFDMSGNNYTGSLVNGPTFGSSNGGAIAFDGADDMVYIPFILNTSTDYTVQAIAKCNNMSIPEPPYIRQTIWAFTGDNTTAGYQYLDLEIWNGKIVSFNGNGTSYTTVGNYNIDANSILMYTLSKTGSIQSWYANSTILGNASQTFNSTSTYFKLGTRAGGTTGTANQNWNGLIYSVRIYNRALSQSEVLQNYNATKARFGL